MENIVIGIEGLVGAGKTTISRELLKLIPNSIILHGGNIYRAIVYTLFQSGMDLKDLEQKGKEIDPLEVLKKANLSIEVEEQQTVVYQNGRKIAEEDLQSEKSSLGVSRMGKIAKNEKLYIFGKSIIDAFKEKYNVILSSRDIVKMYPKVDYHFLITASLEERIRRKCIQYSENKKIEDREEFEKIIRENIKQRDELQEQSGFYHIYDQTIVLDVTEDENARQSAHRILEYVKLPSNR